MPSTLIDHRGRAARPRALIIRREWFVSLTALALLVLLLLPASGALAADDVEIRERSGDVSIRDARGTVSADTRRELVPPVTVETGADGKVELTQGGTSISVAENTRLEIPVPAERSLIDRILQSAGSVFYTIQRDSRRPKLRVETPFLVSVVKGTQFNIVVSDTAATVALYEGRLGVQGIDDDFMEDLLPGQVATRDLGAARVRVIDPDRLGLGEGVRGEMRDARETGDDRDERPARREDEDLDDDEPDLAGRDIEDDELDDDDFEEDFDEEDIDDEEFESESFEDESFEDDSFEGDSFDDDSFEDDGLDEDGFEDESLDDSDLDENEVSDPDLRDDADRDGRFDGRMDDDMDDDDMSDDDMSDDDMSDDDMPDDDMDDNTSRR